MNFWMNFRQKKNFLQLIFRKWASDLTAAQRAIRGRGAAAGREGQLEAPHGRRGGAGRDVRPGSAAPVATTCGRASWAIGQMTVDIPEPKQLILCFSSIMLLASEHARFRLEDAIFHVENSTRENIFLDRALFDFCKKKKRRLGPGISNRRL